MLNPITKIMTSIRGRQLASDHLALLARVAQKQDATNEVPKLKNRLWELRERRRALEVERIGALNRLNGYKNSDPPERFAGYVTRANADLAEIRDQQDDLSEDIRDTEQRLVEAEATRSSPVTVSAAQAVRHRDMMQATQAKLEEVQKAIAASVEEIARASNLPREQLEVLRQDYQTALAGQAMGTHTEADVSRIQAALVEEEDRYTKATAAARETTARAEATRVGLEKLQAELEAEMGKLKLAWPVIQGGAYLAAMEVAEREYQRILSDLIEAYDQVRALRHKAMVASPGTLLPPDPRPDLALQDPQHERLHQVMSRVSDPLG